MSHVAAVSCRIKDIDALEAAVKEMGATLIRGKSTYQWYGQHVGDYPLPAGMTKEQLGKCSHAIKVPGVRYEVGVVRLADGTFTLAYDFYGSGGQHDGSKLKEKFGDNLDKLTQLYSVHVTTKAARAKGWSVGRQTGSNGNIKLVVTGIK